MPQTYRIRSGPYPISGLLSLAQIQFFVWPLPNFWSVLSDAYPKFSVLVSAHSHTLVCLDWSVPIFWSVAEKVIF